MVLDHSERKDYIARESNKIVAQMGLVIKEDNDLLEEVTGLVEYPQVLLGKIDQKFLSVPSEVLSSSMRSHQKYFSLFDQKGDFAPYFLFVSNIAASNPELVIGGNEKVLSARLSDALYFYNQDLKSTLDQKSNKLDKVIFHAKLGTIGDKVQRVSKIAQYLLPNNGDIIKAAMLCKSDIVSEVVGEFPNLQGIMGYYYAKHESLSQDIAVAIRDHYKPQGPSESCPTGMAAFLASRARHHQVETFLGWTWFRVFASHHRSLIGPLQLHHFWESVDNHVKKTANQQPQATDQADVQPHQTRHQTT